MESELDIILSDAGDLFLGSDIPKYDPMSELLEFSNLVERERTWVEHKDFRNAPKSQVVEMGAEVVNQSSLPPTLKTQAVTPVDDIPVIVDTSSFTHPFQILIKTEDDITEYQVQPKGSSVTLGATGGPSLIAGLGQWFPIPGETLIVVGATFDVDGGLDTLGIESIDPIDYDGEVEMVNGSQVRARAIVGKIGINDDDYPFAEQGLHTALRLDDGFFNGSIVKFFDAAASAPESLIGSVI